jgi:hypothetical protein
VKGETGATGPAGPAGPAGKDGAGLGNKVIEVCVSQGGTLQMSVHGQPCGHNQGHEKIKIVVVG